MFYMLDTNIINRLVDERISLSDLPDDGSFIATYVQIEELKNTNCKIRRAKLEEKFQELITQQMPVETSFWDITPWGEGKWANEGNRSGFFELLLAEHDSKNKQKKNNREDVLIAEVVITHRYTLITADQDLATLVENQGGKVKRIFA